MVRNAETAERLSAEAGDNQSGAKAKRLPNVVANTTDPQSGIMPTRKGFLQGYNAQVAVTGDQLVIAVSVSQSTNDQSSFLPMMRQPNTLRPGYTRSPTMPKRATGAYSRGIKFLCLCEGYIDQRHRSAGVRGATAGGDSGT